MDSPRIAMAQPEPSGPSPSIDQVSDLMNQPALQSPWAEAPGDVRDALASTASGLSDAEVDRRREVFGWNRMEEPEPVRLTAIIVRQLRSLVVLLLAAAALVALAMGDVVEAGAIGIVLVLNTAIGAAMEWRAVRSMEALREMDNIICVVVRDGESRKIPADQLVPGDIVRLEEGDLVPADLRLLTAAQLQINESALTGESAPVQKAPEPVEADAVLAERPAMAFKGTSVATGSATGVVVATGTDTEVGEISDMVATDTADRTPLEERLDRLGKSLLRVVLVITVAVGAAGVFSGKDVHLMLETAIALAVAAIPEGLPVVATIALARGLRRMARRNALVRRLSSVETLGATGVICTDKTGTLTENEMRVVRWVPATNDGSPGAPIDPRSEPSAIAGPMALAALCTSATLSDEDGRGTGDPMEIALLLFAREAGVEMADLRGAMPEVNRVAFSRETRQMATMHRVAEGTRVVVKGAPEAVLEGSTHTGLVASESLAAVATNRQSTDDADPNFERVDLDAERRAEWAAVNEELGQDGLRVLALATRRDDGERSTDAPFENLTLLGLIGFLDPPRSDVRDVVETCRSAGIRVVMVTGDQAATARSVALAVGLVDDEAAEVVDGSAFKPHVENGVSIYARVSPRQKLDLIDAFQDEGYVVAMTGDGVNDAPALQRADIGVAMGQRGTQVAQDAADIVLQDDAFATILAAVEEGRTIFGNIRAFVRYLLSCNVAEVMVVGGAAFSGLPLPILPLQILFLNLVTDVFPALALGMTDADENALSRPPRPAEEPILRRRDWKEIVSYSGVISVAVIASFLIAMYSLDYTASEAVTVSFLTLALSQLTHVFNMRPAGSSFFQNAVTHNPYIWMALVLCVFLLAGAVFIPPIAQVLSLSPLTWAGWLVVGVGSLSPFALPAVKAIVVTKR